MKKTYLILLLLASFLHAQAQFSQAARDSIAKLTQEDFNQMLQQLNLDPDQQRRGPSGNPQDPNAANSDEKMVRSYTLPDPLQISEGKKVGSPSDWWNIKRPETVTKFETEMYGRIPENIPGVTWKVIAAYDTTVGNFPIREKLLVGTVDNTGYPGITVAIELLVATPLEAKNPVPLVMEFGFIRSPFGPVPSGPSAMGGTGEPSWKEQLISKGWGYAIIVPSSIQADNGAGLTQGIIGLVNQGKPRTPDQWGSLKAWAWGASRALDYFETDDDVDDHKIAIEGLSRYGKAAAVAFAFEPRFSLGFFGSSGAGGTKLLRRNFGEQVENLASSAEYHWFSGNFIRYAGPLNQDDLPIDAHQLVALCAPRPVFISVGSPFVEGNWIDAKGMFLAGLHAGPVYEALGKKGLETHEFPVLGQALTSNDIAFRQHAGGHTSGPNWSTWIAWASKYWD